MTNEPVFLRADWRYLAMLNYAIDPAILEPHIPPGTELDLFEGRTYVSVVGFRFLNTRVKGIPIPFHRDFDEVNLRFYVRHKAADGWRRGVVFIKELVPRRAIAWVARTLYGENYHAVPMRHAVQPPTDGEGGSVHYEWQVGGRWHGVQAQIEGIPEPAVPGSEAQFITEHYWGYAGDARRPTVEYEVRHPSWRLWSATQPQLKLDAATVYGSEFEDALSSPPTSAFVAEGSEITVHRGRKLQTQQL
jgi:uncharacterized protein YqjF (DUF2071 family)